MFMAPEQANGETIDHRADLFSFGSVLYAMCSGRPPFRAKSTMAVLKRVTEDMPRPIREIIPEVPEWLCDVIAKLHAKRPEDRFASAQEVADLLTRYLAQMQLPAPVKAPRQGAAPAVEKMPPSQDIPEAALAIPRRSRTRRWAAAAAVLLMALGGFGFTEATGVTDFHGTVIRLFSPEGTLVVEVDDPGVSVKIDGSDVVITGAGAKDIHLKPGRYMVEASKEGKIVSRELVSVTKNGRQVLRVSQEAGPNALSSPEETPEVKAAKARAAKAAAARARAQQEAAAKRLGITMETTNSIGMRLRLIPAGTFTMGSSKEEIDHLLRFGDAWDRDTGSYLSEGPEHQVEITRPFYLATTEVTVGQFRQFVEAKGSPGLGARWTDPGFEQTDNHPVVFISWNAAVDFCKWLSDREGKTYRLPTEAEWEYCCRAGISGTRYCYGDDAAQLEDYAWYHKNSGGGTHPVGKKKPNDWGLYDMHGNAWEWCQDYYAQNYYKRSRVKDPMGPDFGGMRVHRGGSYSHHALSCRSAFRPSYPADGERDGFRVLLVLPSGGFRPESGAKDKGVGAQSSDPDRRAAEYVLSNGGTVKVNEQGQEIKAAAGLPREQFRLTHVWLSENRRSNDADMANLGGCKNLREIFLGNTNVGDAGLGPLAGLDKLTKLNLTKTKVTAKGVEGLARALPKCKITWDGGLIVPR
jgi:formylglycine-generating enzyme required for sulfatase activity